MADNETKYRSGIIPARAGFTGSTATFRVTVEDHPRSRGVYGSILRACHDAAGSSPLARGLRGVGGPRPGRPGIIPARAGFTRVILAKRKNGLDHPRSRGVYTGLRFSPPRPPGSSPLARGLRPRRKSCAAETGIIPARAGFTWRRRTICPRRNGSSPLARGLRGANRPATPGGRIIPARAGFTSAWTG